MCIEVGQKVLPKLQPEIVRSAVNRMLDEKTLPEHVLISDEAWQKAIQTRIVVGDLKEPQPTEKSVDNSFALKAQQEESK